MALALSTISYKRACEFIAKNHRHHPPPQGWKFGLAAMQGDSLVGVATIGRPVNRHLDDGKTLEITRVCTDGTRNASSFLYGAARRAVFALGYWRVITYTLASEKGSSLLGAGFIPVGRTRSGSWSWAGRGDGGDHIPWVKMRWESTRGLNK